MQQSQNNGGKVLEMLKSTELSAENVNISLELLTVTSLLKVCLDNILAAIEAIYLAMLVMLLLVV